MSNLFVLSAVLVLSVGVLAVAVPVVVDPLVPQPLINPVVNPLLLNDPLLRLKRDTAEQVDDARDKRAIVLDPVLQQKIMLNPTILDPVLMRGKRAVVVDPMVPSPLLPSPLVPSPFLVDPVLRGKRAVVVDPMVPSPLLPSPLVPSPLLVDPVLRGKRAIVSSDTVEIDDFGNRVEQKVFEETDPILRGKRAVVVDPLVPSPLLPSPLVPSPLLVDPVLRGKRAVVVDPLVPSPLLPSPLVPNPLLVDPVLRGKRAIVSSDTVEVDDFGNRVEQKVFEETDPILRGKRALLVADSYLEALLLNKPIMTETFMMQPMQATMIRGKRDVFEQETVATDAFGDRVEVDQLVRNKRATIIQDVFLTRDLYGNLIEQPVLLIV